LTSLTELPNIAIYTLSETLAEPVQLYLTIDAEAFAVRWPRETNPFVEPRDIEFSTSHDYITKVRACFDALSAKASTASWNVARCEALLEATTVVRVRSGSQESWKDLLSLHLPRCIYDVEIYDRYLRNRYQLKSLEMFLEALPLKAHQNGIKVHITT